MKIKFSSRTHMTTSSLSTQKQQVNDNAKKKKKKKTIKLKSKKKKKKQIRILLWFDTNHLLHSLNSKLGLLFSLTVYFRDQSTPYNEFFYKFKIQTFSTDPFTQSSRLNPPNLFHTKRLKPTNPFTQGSRSNPLIIFIKKTND
jgi:hypothetical protein